MASFKGKAAPSVPVLQDQNGNDFDLSALYGKEALCVFFYPQAMTMGCTKEACALRDVANEPSFTRSDSTPAFRIVGISSDPVDKLKQFEQKYDLPYTLLSDWNQDARKAYGVNGTRLFGIAPDRVTIIIDKEGKVVDTEDSSINMGKHSGLLKRWHEKMKQ